MSESAAWTPRLGMAVRVKANADGVARQYYGDDLVVTRIVHPEPAIKVMKAGAFREIPTWFYTAELEPADPPLVIVPEVAVLHLKLDLALGGLKHIVSLGHSADANYAQQVLDAISEASAE